MENEAGFPAAGSANRVGGSTCESRERSPIAESDGEEPES